MTKTMHVEWHVSVPDGADIELMQERAWVLVPNFDRGFHGLHDIVGRVYVTDDEEDGDGQAA